jgi:hypothetical protein
MVPMELYEVHDIAKLANRTGRAVRNWVAQGRLQAFAVTPRGCHLFHPDDVHHFLATRLALGRLPEPIDLED